MSSESFLQKSIKIGFVVSLYWFVSISMVFLNKQLLKSEEFKLDAPFFVTFFQCFVAIFLCHFIALFARCKSKNTFPSLKTGGKMIAWHYKYLFDSKVSREVLPLSVCFVMMITFNNLSLRDLGVPFYNVGRSLTTLFNVILSYFVLKKTTPPLALVCCGVIMLGYFLGVNVEGDLVSLSYSGIFYGAVASFFVSLNAIFTARVLPAVDGNLWKLGYYNNLNSCVLILPVVVLSSDVKTLWNYSFLTSWSFWATLVVVGVFGFMTGFVSTWQIQVTTPLTHNISGTAKACAQTVIAVVYFHTPKTALWWLSNLMVLMGSLFYAIVRRGIMKEDHAQKAQYEREVNTKSQLNNV